MSALALHPDAGGHRMGRLVLAFGIAVAAHVGVAWYVARPLPTPATADAAGVGGITIDLGPSGGVSGTAAPSPPPPEPEEERAAPEEPPVAEPPSPPKAAEQVPEPVPEVVPAPEPTVDALPVETAELEPEPEPPVEKVEPQPDPLVEPPPEPVQAEPMSRAPTPAVKPPPPKRPTPPEPVRQAPQRPAPTSVEPAPAPTTAPTPVDGPTTAQTTPGAPEAAGAGDTASEGTSTARSGGGDPGARRDYLSSLRAWLERHKEYPRAARLRRQEGTVLLRFTIDRQGRVLSDAVMRSSGHRLLDREVATLLQRAAPLPAMPADVAGATLEVTVPLVFALR